MVNNLDVNYLQHFGIHGHDERTKNQIYAIVDCLNTYKDEKGN